MKIAIIGYGKMGKEIEQIALTRNHEIALIIDTHNPNDFKKDLFNNIEVAIEFTNPDNAFHNVKTCLEFGVPIVSGSTGWQKNIIEAEKICKQYNGSMIISSNFSLGVNLFFNLNNYLTKLMQPYSNYQIGIKEIHHTQKKDAPSGTAVSLAEQILEHRTDKQTWQKDTSNLSNVIGIESERIEDVFGVHHVVYQNPIDEIKISHTAFNRSGFAVGVVLAAEYIHNKRGIFSMKQVLNFPS